MAYVDGFVLAVPTAKKDTYQALAKKMAPLFKEHGALKVVECWGEDVPEGKLTSFPMAVKCEEGESVVFSWLVWPSKEARQAVWVAMMKDESFQPGENEMPFVV